ncbi:MAG: type VI secretion system baseplate subunit TssE [Desulfobacula sp.]|uniref:type VI secretion system baseplate subunit TssE n=1 Tax=Desulfobacula sp. TaxID=2593537 RepID=UPI0025C35C72|nr:type VI secretion system baseplate subunit TssE [Desulfobacula sp.]MCD4721624.1 type VI secretion system baseplate subunit TssE [Desulfobacula sp.]
MKDQFNLTASILDRLIDTEPKLSSEPVRYRIVSERQILESVVRDVENLLNTRCSPIALPVTFNRLKGSLIRYGLRDSTVENPGSILVRQKLCMEIEKAISMFEPRLKKAIVRLETENKRKRQLFFRISGVLVVEPLVEPVSFDTFFDLNRGRYIISK